MNDYIFPLINEFRITKGAAQKLNIMPKDIIKKVKNNHLITFCIIAALNSFSISLFQNFLFDMASKNLQISFRTNCTLQFLSLFNGFGSLFWSKFADTTKKHNQIIMFNRFLYGFLVLSMILIRDVSSKRFQQMCLILITILREFTLGSIGPPQDSLVMNYLACNGKTLSSIGYLNISKNISYILSMLYTIVLEYIHPNKDITKIKMVTFFMLVCISSFLLMFVAPRFSPIVDENFRAGQSSQSLANPVRTEENTGTEIENENEILKILRERSFMLLYLSTVVAGLYKCVNINLLPTFLRIRGEAPRYSPICFAMRAIVVSLTTFLLSNFDGCLSLLFISSIISGICSLVIGMVANYSITAVLFSEFFIGYHRATIVFSTILLFRTYSTPNTQSLVQGIRNSAYNGISCVLFALIAMFTVPSDIIDPNQIKDHVKKEEMTDKLNKLFLENYKNLTILLSLSLIPALTVHFMRKKNL